MRDNFVLGKENIAEIFNKQCQYTMVLSPPMLILLVMEIQALCKVVSCVFTINYSSTFTKADINQNVDATCKVGNVKIDSFFMLLLFMILKSVQPLYFAGRKIMFKCQFSPDCNVLIYIDSSTR